MLLYPNCKINIGLNVVGKREDGYHNLETIFYPVYGLHDILEVLPLSPEDTPACGYRFLQDGIAVDCAPEDNLILRCYRMLREEFAQIQGVSIRFTKRIPFGAGLGGGSSDAAHMAIALNELFSLGLSRSDLAQRVSRLGADCAFFIYNTPCFATGIGDILEPIHLDLSGYRLVMIKPDVAVSTKDAYAGIKPSGRGLESLTDITLLHNDFETTVFARYPLLSEIKERLLALGAHYAAMSGSGSTLFGFFKADQEGGSDANLRTLQDEFASMIIFNDTLGQTQA